MMAKVWSPNLGFNWTSAEIKRAGLTVFDRHWIYKLTLEESLDWSAIWLHQTFDMFCVVTDVHIYY